jgi:hypothetical protein
MNRRGFLASVLGALGSAAVFDPERLLWVPGAKVISIPQKVVVRPGLYAKLYTDAARTKELTAAGYKAQRLVRVNGVTVFPQATEMWGTVWPAIERVNGDRVATAHACDLYPGDELRLNHFEEVWVRQEKKGRNGSRRSGS